MNNSDTPRPLPEGWSWSALGDVCAINPRKPRGFNRSPEAPTTFVPMASVDAVSGTIAWPEERPYAKVARGYTYFEEGDVLFAKITPSMQNRKSAIAVDLIDGIGFGTTEFHVLRPTPKVIPEWILYFLRRREFLVEAKANFRGAVGQQRVPKSFLSSYKMPVPKGVDQQRRIVDELSEQIHQVSEMRIAAETALEAAQAMHGAYLREVFESEDARSWPRVPLASIVERRPGTRDPSKEPDSEFVYVDISSVDNVTKRVTDPKTLRGYEAPSRARRVIRAGDVIVSTTRPNLNAVALVPGELDDQICSTGFAVLRSNGQVDPRYLFYFVRTAQFVAAVSGSERGALYPATTGREVRSVKMPLAPLPEQCQMVESLDRQFGELSHMRTPAETTLEAINAMEGALLNEVFGGYQPPTE